MIELHEDSFENCEDLKQFYVKCSFENDQELSTKEEIPDIKLMESTEFQPPLKRQKKDCQDLKISYKEDQNIPPDYISKTKIELVRSDDKLFVVELIQSDVRIKILPFLIGSTACASVSGNSEIM